MLQVVDFAMPRVAVVAVVLVMSPLLSPLPFVVLLKLVAAAAAVLATKPPLVGFALSSLLLPLLLPLVPLTIVVGVLRCRVAVHELHHPLVAVVDLLVVAVDPLLLLR